MQHPAICETNWTNAYAALVAIDDALKHAVAGRPCIIVQVSDVDRTLNFGRWLEALDALTGSPDLIRAWQEQRFRFAYRIGELLTQQTDNRPSPAGPAVYGVFVRGAGLAYVGQTLDARRRLRDLPIGESHHLANTIPPELWERVVVVEWPRLLSNVNAAERAAADGLGREILSATPAPPA